MIENTTPFLTKKEAGFFVWKIYNRTDDKKQDLTPKSALEILNLKLETFGERVYFVNTIDMSSYFLIT